MKYRISSDDVVFEDFDGEMVVLDLGTGRYFGLNASASVLWVALSTGVETASLADAGAPADWIAGFAAECVLYCHAPITKIRCENCGTELITAQITDVLR